MRKNLNLSNIDRLKELGNYGMGNTNNQEQTQLVEYKVPAADNKMYGIVRETNKYFIKESTDKKNFDYIGGVANKNDNVHSSYNSALKALELKVRGINEDVGSDNVFETQRTVEQSEYIVEATSEMRNSINRFNEIMNNTSKIMKEDKTIPNPKFKDPEAPGKASDPIKQGSPFEETPKVELDKDISYAKPNHVKAGAPFEDTPKASKEIKITAPPKAGKVVKITEKQMKQLRKRLSENYFDDEPYYDDEESDLDIKLRDFNLPSDIEEYNPTTDDADEFDDEFDDDVFGIDEPDFDGGYDIDEFSDGDFDDEDGYDDEYDDDLVEALTEAVMNEIGFGGIKNAGKFIGNKIGNKFNKAGQNIKQGVNQASQNVRQGVNKVGQNIKQGANQVGQNIKQGVDKVGQNVGEFGQEVKQQYHKGNVKDITKRVDKIAQKLKTELDKLNQSIEKSGGQQVNTSSVLSVLRNSLYGKNGFNLNLDNVKRVTNEGVGEFGNHPRYQDPAFTTDANDMSLVPGTEEWDDTSVKSTEPYGRKIGNGNPFNKPVRGKVLNDNLKKSNLSDSDVDDIVESVMRSLKKKH